MKPPPHGDFVSEMNGRYEKFSEVKRLRIYGKYMKRQFPIGFFFPFGERFFNGRGRCLAKANGFFVLWLPSWRGTVKQYPSANTSLWPL
jgi:hypothetical protein